jgi:hypothetical protein
MTMIEILAILILLSAIIILIYYYMENNPHLSTTFKNYIPKTSYKEQRGRIMSNIGENNNENVSVGEKLKIRFKDIDIPSLNTDAFSNKVDAFLNEKSDELIKDWSLATKNDVNELEKRCDTAYRNINDVKKRFNEYREYTNERIESLDKRLSVLEEDNKE